MAVSGISSAPANNYQINPADDFRQTFADLVKTIKSGDLQGAQQAYASLTQLQSNGQGPPANTNSPLNKALSQIGQALQNGDISGAQQMLSTLAQQAQGTHIITTTITTRTAMPTSTAHARRRAGSARPSM